MTTQHTFIARLLMTAHSKTLSTMEQSQQTQMTMEQHISLCLPPMVMLSRLLAQSTCSKYLHVVFFLSFYSSSTLIELFFLSFLYLFISASIHSLLHLLFSL